MTVAHASRRVVTCDPSKATADDPLGVIMDGVVVVSGGRIGWVGPRRDLAEGTFTVDHGDAPLTPGLIDAHTHACWAGSRHAEYAVRMAGGDYEAIARAGGGIVSTHRAVEAEAPPALLAMLRARLRRMATLGVTTVEVKSGYGLTRRAEMKQLECIQAAAADPTLPHVVPTFLALHALPPADHTDRDAYVARVASEVIPFVAQERLAKFVDVYIDAGAFSVEEARRVFEAARHAGLALRAHIGQFHDIGGADLAAELGASSVDHVEHISPAGVDKLASSKTRVVLLPIASFTLGHPPPPVPLFREHGIELVVASDANPGTAPTESLPLALAFAVRSYGLTPNEALLAATRHAAASLGLFGDGAAPPRGVLSAGASADFVVWDLPHEHAIVQPWGVSRARLVVREGNVLHEGS